MENGSIGAILLILVAIGAAFLLISVPQPEKPVSVSPPSQVIKPSSPTASAVQPAFPLRVNAGESFTLHEWGRMRLHGEGYASSGEVLTYHWSVASGWGTFSDASKADPIYTAPSICGCEACIPITLTVTDNRGRSASDQLYVRVRGDDIACLSPPCSQEITIPSRCQPSPLRCASPCVPLVTPVPRCTRAPVPCCSPCGWSMDFLWPPEKRTAEAGGHATPLIDRHYPRSIPEQSAVLLHGTVSNPACTSVCFTWTASKGSLENADTLDPIYHAPASERFGGEDATITLTIHDGFGKSAYDQVRLHIQNMDYRGAQPTQPGNNWLLRQP